MADRDAGSDGRVVFDPVLLQAAETTLRGRPEKAAVDLANSLAVTAGAFGTVPGGAEVGGRLDSWATRARSEMLRVATDVADLAERTGRAKQMATDVDGQTQVIAQRGAPAPIPR